MKTLLTCPVCSRPKIADDICPNCSTNLSVIRMLTELPSAESILPAPVKKQPIAARALIIVAIMAIIILLLGISIGAGSEYWISHLPESTATSNSQQQVAKLTRAEGFRYRVRLGDTIPAIAWRFYRDVKYWELIVKANPQLKGRENYLKYGEVLLIPNREEDYRGKV